MLIFMIKLFIDGRFGLSEFDRFRKKWAAGGGSNVDSNTSTVRRGSLDRRTSYSTAACNSGSGTLNAPNTADNRYSWSSDEYSADTFRPVTLTINGYFKQVCHLYILSCKNCFDLFDFVLSQNILLLKFESFYKLTQKKCLFVCMRVKP